MTAGWTRLVSAEDGVTPVWVKHDEGFMFIANDAFDAPDLERMVLLTGDQQRQLMGIME